MSCDFLSKRRLNLCTTGLKRIARILAECLFISAGNKWRDIKPQKRPVPIQDGRFCGLSSYRGGQGSVPVALLPCWPLVSSAHYGWWCGRPAHRDVVVLSRLFSPVSLSHFAPFLSTRFIHPPADSLSYPLRAVYSSSLNYYHFLFIVYRPPLTSDLFVRFFYSLPHHSSL